MIDHGGAPTVREILGDLGRTAQRDALPIAVFALGGATVGLASVCLLEAAGAAAGSSALVVLAWVWAFLTTAFQSAAITYAINARKKPRAPTLVEIAKHAMLRTPAVLGTTILVVVVTVLATFGFVLPGSTGQRDSRSRRQRQRCRSLDRLRRSDGAPSSRRST